METDLRQGLERNELRLVYQPIVSLADGEIVKVEALARWQHPTRGQQSLSQVAVTDITNAGVRPAYA